MALNLGKIDTSTDRWEHPDDSDVWIEGVPLSYTMRRASAKAVGAKFETDGDFMRLDPSMVPDLAVDNGTRCFKEWGGIEIDGKAVPCDRKHVQLLVDLYGDGIVAPAVTFFQELFETRKDEREAAEKNS